MNILDSLKGLVTDELVNKAASALGEDGGAISNVMQGAIPTVLGGLLGSDSKNHGDLAGLFGQAASNDNLIGDLLGGLTSGGNVEKGGMVSSLLGGIFGDKIGGIANILTNLGGIKSGSASSILSIVGPMVASYLGKKMMKDGLNFSSIMNWLGESKDEIMDAAPEGIADTIGLKKGPWEMVTDLVGNVTGQAGDAVKGAAGAVTGAAGSVVSGAGDAVKGAAGAVTGAAGSVVSGAGDVAKGAAGAVTGAAGAAIGGAGALASGAVGGAKKGMKWLWPLLLVAALAIGAFWLLGKAGCNNAATDMAGDVTNTVGGAAGDVVDGAGDAVGAVADGVGDAANAAGDAATGALDEAGNWVAAKGAEKMIKLDNGVELATTKGSVIDKLYNFSSDEAAVPNKNLPENWFNFEDVQFETGSANLKASANTQIKNAAAILQAFPNVKIKIGGYTDNTGSEEGNVKLSEKRAKAVYNAIMAQGAPASSFDDKAFEGYGSQYPVGDNATDVGRAQNRRIACVVTAK